MDKNEKIVAMSIRVRRSSSSSDPSDALQQIMEMIALLVPGPHREAVLGELDTDEWREKLARLHPVLRWLVIGAKMMAVLRIGLGLWRSTFFEKIRVGP